MTIQEFLIDKNYPLYRYEQYTKAKYQQYVASFEEISNFPKQLREELSQAFKFSSLQESKLIQDSSASTLKALLKTIDGNNIETVLIKSKDRNTVCVSCQVGCPVGCLFCSTGNLGFTRNLTTDEIVDQALYWSRYLKLTNQKVTNIVFMGMGEPLLNIKNVLESIDIITDEKKFGLGQRNITLSTVGIIEPLKKLLSQKHQFRIAISLHSADQQTREKLIPIAKANPISTLISVVSGYTHRAKKRVTFEYILLKGINDSERDADKLVHLLKPIQAFTFVNLIMYNDDPERRMRFEKTNTKATFRFAEILKRAGIQAHIRFSGGDEIAGACGQLAGKD